MSKLLAWHPWTGLFIAILGFVGVVVPLIRDPAKIGRREKAVWTALVFGLLFLEVRSLKLGAEDFERDRRAVIETAENIVDLQKHVLSFGEQLQAVSRERGIGIPARESNRRDEDTKWERLMDSYNQLTQSVENIRLAQSVTIAKPTEAAKPQLPSNAELKARAKELVTMLRYTASAARQELMDNQRNRLLQESESRSDPATKKAMGERFDQLDKAITTSELRKFRGYRDQVLILRTQLLDRFSLLGLPTPQPDSKIQDIIDRGNVQATDIAHIGSDSSTLVANYIQQLANALPEK